MTTPELLERAKAALANLDADEGEVVDVLRAVVDHGPVELSWPPAPALRGWHEVARVAAGPLLVDERLGPLLAWAEATYGPGLAARGDGRWLTLYAPPRPVPARDDDPVHAQPVDDDPGL